MERLGTYLDNPPTDGTAERSQQPMDYGAVQQSGGVTYAEDAAGECPWCRGAKFMAVRQMSGGIFTGNVTKPCGRCAAVRHEARWERIGVAPILRFEDWRDVPEMRPARKACDELLEGKRHAVVLSAQTGRGKTHLAKATVVEWVERGKGSALFRTVPEILDELRSAYGEDTPYSLHERMKTYGEIGLLVLDDLGAEKGTEWAQEKLFSIVDKRLGAGQKRPTFVTSNVHPDSTTIPARIKSRLAPGVIQIAGGLDFRQQSFEPAPWAR